MPMLTAPDTMLFWRNPGSAFGFNPNPTPPKTSFAPVASAQFVCANCTFFFAEKSVTFPFRNVHESPSMSRPREGIETSATNVPLALSSTGATPTSPVGRSTERLASVPTARSSSLMTPSWTYGYRSGNHAGHEIAERRQSPLVHDAGRLDHPFPFRVIEAVCLRPFPSDRANRDGDVLRHLLERL